MKANTIQDLSPEIILACNLYSIENKGKKTSTLKIKKKTYEDFIEHLTSTQLNVIVPDLPLDSEPKVTILQIMGYKMTVEFTDLPYLNFELE